ncbi:MAG: hypothetical protein E7167_06000 [Firmicutes bacterium]|nr:hypothetical protein [Bacillota bacterium]
MTNRFPPNTDPNTFSFIGSIVGAIISSDFNSYELNAIGNWLELVGQYLLTTAAQMQLLSYRNNQNISQPSLNDLELLKKAITKINQELDAIKKDF